MNSWEAFSDAEGNPRDSISTFDSDFSLAASSSFSTGRPSSFASSHTAYSSLSSPSLRSCYSPNFADSRYAGSPNADPSSVYGRGLAGFSSGASQTRTNDRRALLRTVLAHGTPIDDLYTAASRTETVVRTPSPSTLPIPAKDVKSSLAEKKLRNRFACTTCDKTFSKRSGRKSHWKESCQYTSDKSDAQDSKPSLLCPSCNHIARNKHQIGQHQRTHGHIRGTWDPIRLCDKPRFTCSDDCVIYRTAEEFFAHFKSNACKLNQHEKHGKWFHHSRLLTLLQEGRDDLGGQHYGTYARLLIHCSRHDMTENDWISIIASHSEQVAQQFAEKLKWGLALPPLSPAMMRLGFANLEQMVALIVPPPQHSLTVSRLSGTARSASTTDSVGQHVSSQLYRQQPQASQNPPNYYPHTSFEAGPTPDDTTLQSKGPSFNRERNTDSDASPKDWKSRWNPGSMSQAAIMAPPTRSAVSDSPRSFKIASSSELTCFENDCHDDLDSKPWLDLTDTFATQDMLLERRTQSGFPGRTSSRRSTRASTLPQRDQNLSAQPEGPVVASIMDTFTRSATNTVWPAYNESSPSAVAPKAKRPISKTSEVHPESVVRSQRQHRLPFRISSGESKPHRASQNHSSGLSSHRESSESTGLFFDYLKYDQDDIPEPRQTSMHEQSPPRVSAKPVSIIQGVLVPTPSEHFVDSPRRSSVPERPKTTLKEKIKACAKKSFTSQITELEDGDFLSRPPSGVPKAIVPGQCIYCGIVNDTDCLSGHISEVRVRRKHQGTVFEEADLRDLHDLFDFDELRSFGDSDYDHLSKSL
ncbi:hypothetical protein HII31_02820 [Pseudocercospora fuligena]|uniref:C2H2-type domain-containing protein n=1 Tax=Pseudocercospora fuligena TaxID=685502 RepID=A0A8H6RRX2_9PEZI|nr:hypothetical protein HII31_02820 [Pseudocercospora fuligena]